MTQDEILSMARDAGMEVHPRKDQIRIGYARIAGLDSTPEVMRFAALVAAKAVAEEREACAQLAAQTVCDLHIPTGVKIYGSRAAKAIRARGCNV